MIILFWMVTSVYTVCGIVSGALFFSPALADLPDPEEKSTAEP